MDKYTQGCTVKDDCSLFAVLFSYVYQWITGVDWTYAVLGLTLKKTEVTFLPGAEKNTKCFFFIANRNRKDISVKMWWQISDTGIMSVYYNRWLLQVQTNMVHAAAFTAKYTAEIYSLRDSERPNVLYILTQNMSSVFN